MIFMRQITVYPMGNGRAVSFAARELAQQGVRLVPSWDRSVTHILLDVPTKDVDLADIPPDVTLIGGNLDEAAERFPVIDLLKDAQYLLENAAITADCALRLLGDRLSVAFRECPILVIGWGRIGKYLAAMLKGLEAQVSVAARKSSDLGMLTALGYNAVPVDKIDPKLYRAIINTAPAKVLAGGGEEACVQIDLASQQGIMGENVLWARGLPGKMLPEESGKCIARSVLRLLGEGSV